MFPVHPQFFFNENKTQFDIQQMRWYNVFYIQSQNFIQHYFILVQTAVELGTIFKNIKLITENEKQCMSTFINDLYATRK